MKNVVFRRDDPKRKAKAGDKRKVTNRWAVWAVKVGLVVYDLKNPVKGGKK